jgi:predicted nucleic acid-binding protein
VTQTYLADTSAWRRSGATAEVYEHWSGLVLDGRLGTCSPVRLELLYSARGPTDYAALDHDLRQLPALAFDSRAMTRAEVVQALLSARSQHRAPTPADLYIAAIAEVNDAVLLHYDRHFDAIARVTGQPAEWIAPRGSLD